MDLPTGLNTEQWASITIAVLVAALTWGLEDQKAVEDILNRTKDLD
jgi:hypothetical protein